MFEKFLSKINPRIVACMIPGKKRRHAYRKKRKNAEEMQFRQKEYKEIKQAWAEKLSEPLIPGRFAEYDLVFSIGAACMMTFVLKHQNLRMFSNPFDWTGGVPPVNWNEIPGLERDTRFREKIDCLCNNFVDYFNPDDLKQYSFFIPGCEHTLVANVRNNIRFAHIFDVDKSMETQMLDICEKIARRAKRLLSEIDKSNRILICWGHRMGDQLMNLDAPVSDVDIKYAVDKLREKWPDKEFDIVFFEHDGTKAAFEYDKIHVCSGAYRIRSNHFVYESGYLYKYAYPRTNKYKQPQLVIAEALDNIRLISRTSVAA